MTWLLDTTSLFAIKNFNLKTSKILVEYPHKMEPLTMIEINSLKH